MSLSSNLTFILLKCTANKFRFVQAIFSIPDYFWNQMFSVKKYVCCIFCYIHIKNSFYYFCCMVKTNQNYLFCIENLLISCHWEPKLKLIIKVEAFRDIEIEFPYSETLKIWFTLWLEALAAIGKLHCFCSYYYSRR